MSYIKTPENESAASREASQLRSAVDQVRRAYDALQIIADRNSQILTDAEGAQLYGYTDVQDYVDMKSLTASAVGELDAAPFFQQLISRLG